MLRRPDRVLGVAIQCVVLPLVALTGMACQQEHAASLVAPVEQSQGITPPVSRPSLGPRTAASTLILDPIGDKTTMPGVELTFSVTARHDPDSDLTPIRFTIDPLPSGATFDGRPDWGLFSWTPTCEQGGSHIVTFCADDGVSQDCETTSIYVSDTNHPPVANPGGPYAGCPGLPIAMSGALSSDPDLNTTLRYQWEFGDGVDG
ncbi:MAG TPA: PKD domain-containing protein, partial [Candidatus Eisenbacteria bacterium]|nr:PKD domain-containing protein [Candidatus Eisenbacteria bacterium]